jgi:hypothetical protein
MEKIHECHQKVLSFNALHMLFSHQQTDVGVKWRRKKRGRGRREEVRGGRGVS